MLTDKGMSAREIATALGRSVRWVRKWRRRARAGDARWYQEGSRAPRRPGRRVDAKWEAAVVAARTWLEGQQESGDYAFVGAIAVRRELERRGVPVEGHSLRQIERLIQRHRFAQSRRRRRRGRGPKRFYPGPHWQVRRPGDLHEVDFVGPLYLRGGSRLVVLSRVDLASGSLRCWVATRQSSDVVCAALWQDWQRPGLPRHLQMDNQAPFVGGLNGCIRAKLQKRPKILVA